MNPLMQIVFNGWLEYLYLDDDPNHSKFNGIQVGP